MKEQVLVIPVQQMEIHTPISCHCTPYLTNLLPTSPCSTPLHPHTLFAFCKLPLFFISPSPRLPPSVHLTITLIWPHFLVISTVQPQCPFCPLLLPHARQTHLLVLWTPILPHVLFCISWSWRAWPREGNLDSNLEMADHQTGQPEGISMWAIRSDHTLSPRIAKQPAICLHSCPRCLDTR